MTARINTIAALGLGRVIGNNNELLWHIPDDLKRFKTLTLGHPCIMGRKTFDSIIATLGKPLPGRTSIVLTRGALPHYDNVVTASSVEDALSKARDIDSHEVFICGGGQVYAQFLPKTDKLYLTLIDDEKEGDAYFPRYETLFTKKVHEEHHAYQGLSYSWLDLERET